MDLQTFSAATMTEALQQVKSKMGHDAVILHTRTLSRRYWLGTRRREIVEITAGRGLHLPDRRRRGAPAMPYRATEQRGDQRGDHRDEQQSQHGEQGRRGFGSGEYGGSYQPQSPRLPAAPRSAQAGAYLDTTRSAPVPSLSSAAIVPAAPNALHRTHRQEFLETPAANNAVMMGLAQDVTSLKSLVKDLVCEVRHKQAPQVPEALFNHYMQLIENQVADEIAIEVVKAVCEQLRPEHLTQPELVNEKIAEHLEKLISSAGPITRTKAVGPHIVALIGPTGVGKTTTLAKLAANLQLREHRRVGLITLDTYRIAAVDQLRKYADIIGSPIRAASTPEELQEAVASMNDCEFILIDTAGRSPKDTMKLNELKQLLAAIDADGPDEVHLVLSTTASQSCVELAIARFSDVRVDRIIFTKLDEAAHIGVLLNVVRKVNKSLSYITTGQDVPNDIEVGRGRLLARRIMGVAM